eukprot:TRINITY_DN9329_c0_g1_i3.p1 TRINITY_DN9329_c0_g1~~TRINITY_DN9329_c0_g1_i3.p1  ORF type:complete len:193 (-),score=76.89 TRINITY_DN9329_c0_g1_i3:140-718(-)
MAEFADEAAKAESEMVSRQDEELRKFEEELNASLPVRPKDSSELLNLRKIEENMARQKDYIEAHKVQQRCLMLEREEQEKWSAIREGKIRNQVNLLVTKQQQELAALRQRVSSAQDEQRKARSVELERLIQKYQNIKKELEVQQQLELQRLDRSLKTGGSVMRSSYGSRFGGPASRAGLRSSPKQESGSKGQ